MVRCSFFAIMLMLYCAGVRGQYENCTGRLNTVNDGKCDSDNNYAECGYDGGDCCECSCTTDRLFPCGIWGFKCSDPDMLGKANGCQVSSSITPCSNDDIETWFVNDTISATTLAAAVNCSGGTFHVIWRGRVLVDYTIAIPNGTTLYITGEETGAELNGGGKTRLLKVVDGTLHVNGLNLSDGNATYGGAIAATRSVVFLNQTLCRGNTASSYGGAIYVGIRSTLVSEGKAVLTNNHAHRGGGAVSLATNSIASWGGTTEFFFNLAIDNDTFGGAVYASDQSRVTWNGETSFINNRAGYCGGALSAVYDSTVSWDGVTSFMNNTAGYGGALVVYFSGLLWNGSTSFVNNSVVSTGGVMYIGFSIVSWDGITSFVNNKAEYGGALDVYESNVSWDGVTSFNNNAAIYGGALRVEHNCRVSWDGVTSFVGNMADYKGVVYVGWSSVVFWSGVTGFVNNTAEYGGALVVYDSNVSWDGETSFNNNAAMYGGALRVEHNCSVSWDGVTSFVGNMADYKGVVYVGWSSVVFWSGVTDFVNNTAEYGGALVVYESNVSWAGVTSFVNNTAEYGGALVVYESNISWNGLTSFVDNSVVSTGGVMYVGFSSVSWDGITSFVNNTAGYGGALDVHESNVSWDGVTSFDDNSAIYGGALRVEHNCRVSWDGVTSFVGNMADYKGVVYVGWSSVVFWSGVTDFVNNMATYGGALSVHYSSTASWTGETSFIANHAVSAGGAIYVATSSNITIGGDTNFLDNESDVDGGAIYVHVSYVNENSSFFIVENNLAVLFQGNKCGANGGASAFIGGVVMRFPLGITFLENTAGIAGGAIYMSGVAIGIRFEGTIFSSNSALIGGGVYSTGSGTAVTEDIKGIPAQNPSTFIGCKFIENGARTGGAMYSGAGRDMIVNTSFVRNSASIGGALRLVGTTSLNGCEFRENLSGDEEGPGISNDGVISDLSRCSFVDNGFNCRTGFFLYYNDTVIRFHTVCKGCDTPYNECVLEGKEPTCLEELEHSTSAGGNTTLEFLLIERGYWRATNRSIEIFPCFNAEACLGGSIGEKGYCRKGYEGPYCSICSKGYTASLGFACNKCSANAAGGIAIAVVTAAAFLLAFAALFSYMLSGEREDADQGIVARLTRFIPLHSVKIVIVVWQILTQFSAVANVVFPSVYQRFLDGVDILNFDLSWVISAGCIIETDFHDQLLLITIGPLVCIPILGCTYVTAMRRRSASEEGRSIVYRKHVSMVLLLTFLVYSSVSSTLFKTFACNKLDDGKNYLRADYRIDCDSSRHKAFEVYAGFMVVIYVIGIPALYGVLLYNNRKALKKNVGREEDESIKPISDLWTPYKPDRYDYEVIECVRRVLLTGALVFIYPNTAAQIAVALMMATFFIFVSEALAPYASPWDTWCNRTGHAIIYVSMFLALLLKMDVSGEQNRSQRVFESVLVGVHSCMVLIVVVETVATVMIWKEEKHEHTGTVSDAL